MLNKIDFLSKLKKENMQLFKQKKYINKKGIQNLN